MASSDDEEETMLQSVSNYYFLDDKDEPITFSVLPIHWSENENMDGSKKPIFLHGTVDNGLQKIYKHVMAWRFNLTNMKPEISVLTKENLWVKLQKPRKSYEDLIRTVLITVHCLHFFKRNTEVSGKSLWDYMSRVFSLYELRPSQNDLVDHMALIREAVERDDSLAKSKYLVTFLEEKPRKRKLPDEDIQNMVTSGFIVDDMDDDKIDDVEEDEFNEEEYFDSVCTFCDNGGDLLCCEGRCLRSFHATSEAGDDSLCESLGLTNKEVKAMQNFFCKNCECEQHQCFACGKLGSSVKSSSAEVIRCAVATCGYFYHPHCVAKLLHQGNEADSDALEKRIATGETFLCPIHKCCVCKLSENKKDPELQFAVCRRCPKSYHRKCLPREIAFEDIEEEGIITRAWDGLLSNRILIYCLKHEIDDDLGTPMRDHIKFPVIEGKKSTVEEKKKKNTLELSICKEKFGLKKKKNLILDDSHWGRTPVKAPKQLSSAVKDGETTKKCEKVFSGPDTLRKVKLSDASRKSLKNNMKSSMMEVDRFPATNENKASLGERLYNTFVNPVSDQVKLGKRDTADGGINKNVKVHPATKKLSSELPSLDADSERRLLALMKESSSSVTLEEVIEKHKVPSTHAYSSKYVVDKTITLGRVDASVEAVRTALQKLMEGNSIEDAKAVCEPEILSQIFKWKEKLRVYLAPFLYGMRYTSFGRHFTKVEKLAEIVDKLHPYVQDGDMIVDFCCGANDFSCLMKKKLEERGKKCSYKNYDVIQPKNDFNFEKRDWMTVQKGDLIPGSNLIMGLNPPFGVKAALANKFINKALEFNPKLLILIVPPETERLNKKKLPYELVWEDDQFLSGKSFYLPGSVDENDKQMDQWNLKSPPLSLWSRRDWAANHKEIAQKHGHLSRQPGSSHLDRNSHEAQYSAHATEDHGGYGDTSMLTIDQGGDDLRKQKDEREEPSGSTNEAKGDIENSHLDNDDREGQDGQGYGKNQSNELPRKNKQRKRKRGEENFGRGMDENPLDKQSEMPRKWKRGEENIGRGMDENSTLDKQIDGRPSVSDKYNGIHSPLDKQNRGRPSSISDKYIGIPHPSPSNVMDGRSSLERGPSNQNFDLSVYGSRMQFGASYGGTLTSVHDDMGRKHNANLEEPFTGYMRDGADSLDYRPYISEVGRESDIGLQVRFHGQDFDTYSQRGYLSGHDPGYGQLGSSLSSFSYGHLGSAPDPSDRMNTSAMQRYAPRLDELNHTRMNSFGSEPCILNSNGIYDPRAARPGNGVDPMGFAHGPHHPFLNRNSAGWLNE